MRLEHYSEEKLKREILALLGRHLDLALFRVFFFGSRVTPGKGTDRSDIDVGIDGPPVPSKTWLEIREEVENFPSLYKIEIVDFRRVAPIFRKVALRYTEDLMRI